MCRDIRLMGSWARHEPTVAPVALAVLREPHKPSLHMSEPVKEGFVQDQTRNETAGAFESLEWTTY